MSADAKKKISEAENAALAAEPAGGTANAITIISEAEDAARIARSAAALDSKRAIEDAEKSGHDSVVSATRNAEEKVKEIRTAAAKSISDRVKALAAVTENECEELKLSVGARLDRAAEAIIKAIIAERTATG